VGTRAGEASAAARTWLLTRARFRPTIGKMSVETLDWATLAARLGLALAAGAVVGFERARSGKPAGMRTHMLVSLGACLFILGPVAIGMSTDALGRAIQGVATGVGFLGAGEILHYFRQDEHRAKIKGLTSAAALWLTAALGVVAACGLWRLLLLSIAAALVVLVSIKPLEKLGVRKPRDDEAP
jgi:putative Mg2+ transporter-C (MgtC) family protein